MTEIMVGLIPVATFAIGFLVGRSHARGAMRARLARVQTDAGALYAIFSAVAAENKALHGAIAELRDRSK